jgi:hypothetical protein
MCQDEGSPLRLRANKRHVTHNGQRRPSTAKQRPEPAVSLNFLMSTELAYSSPSRLKRVCRRACQTPNQARCGVIQLDRAI